MFSRDDRHVAHVSGRTPRISRSLDIDPPISSSPQEQNSLEAVAKDVFASTACKPTLIELNHASLVNIEIAADRISANIDRTVILINSAALVSLELQEIPDGLELQLSTNHIGHFYLISLLTPLLLAKKTSRVANSSSIRHKVSPTRLYDYRFTGRSIPSGEQLPPVIETDHSHNPHKGDTQRIVGNRKIWKTHDQGIATMLAAALDPKIEKDVKGGTRGGSFNDCQSEEVAEYAKDSKMTERL
ncbi:hypothetical protein DOTSEDRAFT_20791 [Dothistroma septosporum NZE10]|uniref:Uncharacterized protein n=1 Tax=Dothistroma septosporum (strain NZE10 / CBS 128990) TaxID=675120 RepID=N1PXL8_DOTSN|nr:hypothetical protein DOTSEDRAFT_20791 [Dothistroma septosporum NZE10]